LIGAEFGGQIGWLLVFAGVCAIAGVAVTWRARRSRPEWGGWLLWASWLAVSAVILSFGGGVGHLYYANELAPPLAAVVGAGTVLLWRAWRNKEGLGWLLPVGVAVQIVVAIVVALHHQLAFPWLAPVIYATGGIGMALLLWSRQAVEWPGDDLPRLARVASVVFLSVALLAGPVAWCIGPFTGQTNGNDPRGGPRQSGPNSIESVAVAGAAAARLDSIAGNTRYRVLLPSTMEAGAWIVGGDRSVAGLGGYTGTEPMPSLGVLHQWFDNGELGFVLISRTQPARAWAPWVESHCLFDPAALAPRSVSAHHYRAFWCGGGSVPRSP
jgi:4-amino-4-deoxy-L-arabinose transferase-like glycosyltransferase